MFIGILFAVRGKVFGVCCYLLLDSFNSNNNKKHRTTCTHSKIILMQNCLSLLRADVVPVDMPCVCVCVFPSAMHVQCKTTNSIFGGNRLPKKIFFSHSLYAYPLGIARQTNKRNKHIVYIDYDYRHCALRTQCPAKHSINLRSYRNFNKKKTTAKKFIIHILKICFTYGKFDLLRQHQKIDVVVSIFSVVLCAMCACHIPCALNKRQQHIHTQTDRVGREESKK